MARSALVPAAALLAALPAATAAGSVFPVKGDPAATPNAAGDSAAQEETTGEPHARVSLHPAQSTVQPGDSLEVALRFEIDENWHLYWTNPGDSGMAPTLELEGAEGGSSPELTFPVPHRMRQRHLVSYGYTDRLTLLFELDVPEDLEPGAHFEAQLEAEWLVCRQACLLESETLPLALPVVEGQGKADPETEEMIEAARQLLPQPSGALAVSLGPVDDGRLPLELDLPDDFDSEQYTDPYFFSRPQGVVEPAGQQRFDPPVKEGGRATLSLPLLDGIEPPNAVEGLLVFDPLEAETPRLAYEVQAERETEDPPPEEKRLR